MRCRRVWRGLAVLRILSMPPRMHEGEAPACLYDRLQLSPNEALRDRCHALAEMCLGH
ncbi:hypothetical protein D9M68_103660 [compost metagenome]